MTDTDLLETAAAKPTDIGLVDLLMDDDLAIRWIAGTGTLLVVIFTGAVKNVDGTDKLEFLGIGSAGGKNHVLFITDINRSYYSASSMRLRIAQTVRALMADHAIEEVHALGNSMGGYGAIMLSGILPCKTVSAMVPAVSLESHITDGPRWKSTRPFLSDERVTNLVPVMQDQTETKYYIIFADGLDYDRVQLRLLPRLPNLTTFVYPGINHVVASQLKEEGLLGSIIRATMLGKTHRVRNLVEAHPRMIELKDCAAYVADLPGGIDPVPEG